MTKTEIKQRVMTIADYLFANPGATRPEIMALYGAQWQLSSRTIDRVIKEAREYNTERLEIIEKANKETLIDEATNAIKEAVATRNEVLEVLSGIIRNGLSDSDRIRAAAQISKMEGWEKAQRIDIQQILLDIETGTD